MTKIKVVPGVIPRHALEVLAKGFGRKVTDPHVETLARKFLEAWDDARIKASGYRSIIILPTMPLRAIEDGHEDADSYPWD